MKAIALVLAALSLSAGTTAVAEPVESAESVVPMDYTLCGYPPIPPYGCKVGTCSCAGERKGIPYGCHWTFDCN